MLAARTRRSAARLIRRQGVLRLIRCTDGAMAVEFGLVLAPFVAMLFAILQTTLVFFAGRVLDTAVAQSARLILTGQAQDQGMNQSAFASAVCGKIYALFNCSSLMIDVQTAGSFSNASQTYLKFQPPCAACCSFCVGYPTMVRAAWVFRSTKMNAAPSMR